MQIKKLVDTINRTYVPSEYLRQPDIYYFMDRVIDDINERLQACYPTFSEWEDYVEEYNKQFGPTPVPTDEPFPDPNADHPLPPPPPPRPDDHGQHTPAPHGPHYPPGTHGPHDSHVFHGAFPYRPEPPRVPKDRTVYDVIPDKYLRSVVALGTALYFYTQDEEGEQIAYDYQQRYEQQLFYMVRDYHMLVPPEFQNNTGGYIDFSYVRERGPWNLHPRGVVMRGYNSKVL